MGSNPASRTKLDKALIRQGFFLFGTGFLNAVATNQMKPQPLLWTLCFSIGCFTTSVAYAKDYCKNPVTQIDINQCAHQEFKVADASLNKNYNQLVQTLDSQARQKLKEAQLAWIKFRDLQCDYETEESRGGTIVPMIYSSCLTRMTKQRNKEWQDLR